MKGNVVKERERLTRIDYVLLLFSLNAPIAEEEEEENEEENEKVSR